MATNNDITGDSLVSKSPTEAYRDGWDRIFGQKKLEKNTDKTKDYVKDSEISATQVSENE